jgi:hypothetical protein
MKILVTGGNGKLATRLKKYLKGDFLGKEELDLTNLTHINNLQTYDMLIHTAKGNIDISLNFEALIKQTNPKKIFAFTSRQGTFMNWKENSNIKYGLEKLILNFVIYRHSLENNNALLIEPGHMETDYQYEANAKKFNELFHSHVFKKNMILDLNANRYLPF